MKNGSVVTVGGWVWKEHSPKDWASVVVCKKEVSGNAIEIVDSSGVDAANKFVAVVGVIVLIPA